MGTEKRTSNRINENASSKVTGRENWRHQPWELRQMQSLSLGAKKRMTFDRIKGWYETFDENVLLSQRWQTNQNNVSTGGVKPDAMRLIQTARCQNPFRFGRNRMYLQ